tara:strand:+ start:81 stop:1787 length:1707 start_codon:yes stop_codon:yes gene_type:complete
MRRNEIFETMLAKGYFPKELPSVFETKSFAVNAGEIFDEWNKKGIIKKDICRRKINGAQRRMAGCYLYKLASSDPEIISIPKKNYERRNIHLVHPVPQTALVYELAENWRIIQKWLAKQKYSMEALDIKNDENRSINEINFIYHFAKKKYIESVSDWVVRTDISRFYPSIYTHSIPWAAYGKGNVKRDINKFKGSLADRLDILVRSCNKNQTIGIPIGPDTSRILAEIISSSIDSEIFRDKKMVGASQVDRLQDDWFVGLNSLEDAEKVLSLITIKYREYGLDINGSKTSIDRTVIYVGDPWLVEIGSFLSHSRRNLKGARLREFLNLVLRQQVDYPRDPVMNYALSVLEGKNYADDEIENLESFLLKAIVLSPQSIDRICRILVNVNSGGEKISRKRFKSRLISLAEKHLERGDIFEAMWLIYTLRGLKISINSRKLAENIEYDGGSVIPLILLDMKNASLYHGRLPTNNWENRISNIDPLADKEWLLAYEGIRQGWIKDNSNIMNHQFFKSMSSRNVYFYDKTKNVRKSVSVRRQSRSIRVGQNASMERMIRALRIFGSNIRGIEY